MSEKFPMKYAAQLSRFSRAAVVAATLSGTLSVNAQTPCVAVSGEQPRAYRGGQLASAAGCANTVSLNLNMNLSLKPLVNAATASALQARASWGGVLASAPTILSLEPRANAPLVSAWQARASWGGVPALAPTKLTLKPLANAPLVSAWQARASWGGVLAPTPTRLSLELQANAPAVSAWQVRASWGGVLAPASTILSLEPLNAIRGNEAAVSASQARVSWGGVLAPATRFFDDAQKDDKKTSKVKAPEKNSPEKNPEKNLDAALTGTGGTNGIAAADDAQVFELMYENFRRTYRLGPADEIAIRVRMEPDYSIDKAKISPDGRVFHPLLGDVIVGGLTVEQLTKKLSQDLAKYIKKPEVSVQLLEAHSAKVGVLGEVGHPGILPMTGPLTVLEAITQSGGFAKTGSRNNVSLLRQGRNGKYTTLQIDMKKLLAGKADAEENLPLQPGDTVIVHGNFLKKLEYVTALSGFSQFLAFVALAR